MQNRCPKCLKEIKSCDCGYIKSLTDIIDSVCEGVKCKQCEFNTYSDCVSLFVINKLMDTIDDDAIYESYRRGYMDNKDTTKLLKHLKNRQLIESYELNKLAEEYGVNLEDE